MIAVSDARNGGHRLGRITWDAVANWQCSLCHRVYEFRSEAVEDPCDVVIQDDDLMPDPRAITTADLKTMVMQEDDGCLTAAPNGRVILDLFAGPGGWSEGLRTLGLSDLGIELDATACATRAAAGHATIQGDVEQLDPAMFDDDDVWGIIASPPCPDFSLAGKRAGVTGESGRLIWEPMRYISRLSPAWVAMEQVPPALDIWRKYAYELRDMGYGVWCGILNAADYGVPQTRERAILIAVLDGPATPPEPTHALIPDDGGMFNAARKPWVSMADALGWPDDCLIEYQRGEGMIERHGARPGWLGSEPCFTLRAGAYGESFNLRVRTGANTMKHSRTGSKAGDGGVVAYERPIDRPAPTVDTKALSAWSWCWDKPATTIAGDPRITARCHHDEGSQGKNPKTTEQVRAGDYDGTEPIKLTIREALILQGFRADYPVQGNKTKQSEQVGNAVPPPLAAAIIGALVA